MQRIVPAGYSETAHQPAIPHVLRKASRDREIRIAISGAASPGEANGSRTAYLFDIPRCLSKRRTSAARDLVATGDCCNCRYS